MISRIKDPGHIEGITPPLWFTQIVQLYFSQSIIDRLRLVPLLSKEWVTDHVSILLPFPDRNQPPVNWFVSCGIPVWYCWGQHEHEAHQTHRDFPLNAPPQWQIQEATTWITQEPTPLPEPQPFEDVAPAIKPTAELTHWTPASPDPNASTILYVMSAHDVIMQFFKERDANNQKKLAKEMLVERQCQESHNWFPPIRSAPVYVWKYNPNAPGFIS
ncbi:hypothetical protein AN958_01827 [Leucoagaricus sp. SymC.cos]|nr:hypothetical protein AN958_01827 [Leucoagaricus sp. SymC.cos]